MSGHRHTIYNNPNQVMLPLTVGSTKNRVHIQIFSFQTRNTNNIEQTSRLVMFMLHFFIIRSLRKEFHYIIFHPIPLIDLLQVQIHLVVSRVNVL